MGFGLCTTIVVGAAMPRSWRMPVIGVVSVCALLFVAVNFERLVAFKRDKNLSAAETADSVKLRPIFAAVAWKMFQDQPLLGCGYGQYPNAVVDYVGDRSTPLMLERAREYVQHNVVLALICETGLAGTVPFLLVLCMWMWDGWRLWRNTALPLHARQMGLLTVTLVANYFLNGMFHDVSLIPMDNMLLFFITGISSGLAAQYAASQHQYANVPVNYSFGDRRTRVGYST
jgi:O-antigen ligase